MTSTDHVASYLKAESSIDHNAFVGIVLVAAIVEHRAHLSGSVSSAFIWPRGERETSAISFEIQKLRIGQSLERSRVRSGGAACTSSGELSPRLD